MLIVVLVAVAVRLLSVCSAPLIITWDGQEYITAALELYEHHRIALTSYRTPGYPLLLAGAFWVFGPSAIAVLAAQHLLGVLMCFVTAWAACRLTGPVGGLVFGLAIALEPLLLSYECHALSESPSTVLAVLCTAIPLADRRALPRTGVLLGLLLGIACLIRPSLQILVPFYAIAWVIRRPPGFAHASVRLATLCVGLALVTAPWLIYNHQRGVNGLARGSAIAGWYGLSRCGLLIPPGEYVGPRIAEAYRKHLVTGKQNSEEAIWLFYGEAGVLADANAYRVLSRWQFDSIRHDPVAYGLAALRGILWQIDIYPPGQPYFESTQNWFMARLRTDGGTWGQNAANFNIGPDTKRLDAFAMHRMSGGLLDRFYGWYVPLRPPGWPQVPLFVLTVAGLVIGVWRRNWVLALVCAGSLAFIGVHALMLLAQPRYGVPAWGTWYITAAGTIGALLQWRAQRRGAMRTGDVDTPASAPRPLEVLPQS